MSDEMSKAAHLELGRCGERLAVDFIKSLGYRIVAMNFSARLGRYRATNQPLTGEIDIIAYEGERLCFIEVKTRRSAEFAEPEAAVDLAKQRRLARTARRYCTLYGLGEQAYRFDVVAIVWPAAATPQVRLIRDFFTPRRGRVRLHKSVR